MIRALLLVSLWLALGAPVVRGALVASLTQPDATSEPPPRFGHTIAYDAIRGHTILFGGTGAVEQPSSLDGPRRAVDARTLDDTWILENTATGGQHWRPLDQEASHPSARADHVMAYDCARGVTVLYGGRDAVGAVLTDTWEYDGTRWSQVSTYGPGPRTEAAMAFDPGRSICVLHGGLDAAGVPLTDTWAFDGIAWQPLDAGEPTDDPGAGLSGHAMAYDSARDAILLYGGTLGGQAEGAPPRDTGSTWVLENTGWARQSPVLSPFPRHGHVMAADDVRGGVLLHGGASRWEAPIAYLNDAYRWNGTSWVYLDQPRPRPGGRSGHSLAYDRDATAWVLFGGIGSGDTPMGDTWIGAPSAWVLLAGSWRVYVPLMLSP